MTAHTAIAHGRCMFILRMLLCNRGVNVLHSFSAMTQLQCIAPNSAHARLALPVVSQVRCRAVHQLSARDALCNCNSFLLSLICKLLTAQDQACSCTSVMPVMVLVLVMLVLDKHASCGAAQTCEHWSGQIVMLGLRAGCIRLAGGSVAAAISCI